jgi:transposase
VIVFADEVGFLMNPCVKGTWAPKGKTPVVQYRNRHHRKVSALGAIALHADGRLELLTDWYPDRYVRAAEARSFVDRLLAHFPNQKITLVWDKLQAHRSKLVKEAVIASGGRLTIEHLPSYAPDLNPVEGLWCLTKYHRMANHGIDNVEELHAEAKRHVDAVGSEERLLKSCFGIAKLNLPEANARGPSRAQ